MLLADLGADVIKIEPPDGGDQTRGAMGFKMKGPDSMGFLNMNRNKRSVDARPQDRLRRARCSTGWRKPPTSWSRTTGPA